MVFETENQPGNKEHSIDAATATTPTGIHIAFDDHRLVANAGLILPATLALRLGLSPNSSGSRLDLGNARRGGPTPATR